MRRIGVFGGTFDPIHHGHLRAALDIQQLLALDQVRLIPCHRPPHRGEPALASDVRLHLLRCAVDGVRGLIADERELLRDKPSYTVDTLLDLRREYPNDQLFTFLGWDSFDSFTRWHRWEDILSLTHLAVTPRPGQALGDAARALLASREASIDDELPQTGRILVAPVTQLDISATRIRQMCREGQDIHYLLPESVREYIERRRLYRRDTRDVGDAVASNKCPPPAAE